MNELIEFVTEWLFANHICHEVQEDLSIKIFMVMGTPRKKTFVGRFNSDNVYLEYNGKPNLNSEYYYVNILSVPRY